MIFELGKVGQPYLQWPDAKYSIPAEKAMGKVQISIPVTSDNILIVGKIGSGKTTLVKGYVSSLLKDEDTYAVFFEVKPGDYSGKYMQPEDKLISFRNVVEDETKMFKWGMIREIKQSRDPESETKKIASILFEHLKRDLTKQIWSQGAEELFVGFINTIVNCVDGTPSNYDVIQRMRTMNTVNLLKFMANYKPNESLLDKYFHFKMNWVGNDSEDSKKKLANYEVPQFGSDLLAFLQGVLSRFGGDFLSKDGEDTIGSWLAGEYGKNLFITYDLEKQDEMSLFAIYFLKSIILERVSLNVDRRKKVLMVLDEVPELGHEFGLEQGVTIGRENRLQVILSTQSLEKLYAIASDINSAKMEHYTNAMLAGFPVLVCFQPGDPYTIATFQKFFGNKEKQTYIMPLCRYSDPMLKVDVQPIVADEAFASLMQGECYIKIGAAEPERVHIVKK